MTDFEIWEAVYTDTEDPDRKVIKRLIFCVEKFPQAAAKAYDVEELWNEVHELPSGGYLALHSVTYLGLSSVAEIDVEPETLEQQLIGAVFPNQVAAAKERRHAGKE